MARKITFEIITKAQTGELRNLARALDAITKSAKGLNKDVQLGSLQSKIEGLGAEARKTSRVISRAGQSIRADLGDQTERSARNVESLTTRMKELTRATSTLDRARGDMKRLNDRVAESEERLAEAKQRVAEATSRLRRVERNPNRTVDEIDEAKEAYNDATKAVQKLETGHKKLRGEFAKVVQDGADAERQITDIEDALEALRKTADGEDILKKFLPPSSARDLRVARTALNDFHNTMENSLKVDRGAFNRISQGIGAVKGQMTQLGNAIPTLKEFRSEVQAMARLDMKDMQRAIGNPDAILRTTTSAVRNQANEAIKLRGEMGRLINASARWASAETEAKNAVASGTVALHERNRIQKMLTAARSQASSVETTAAKRQQQLLSQQRDMMEEQLRLINRINAAQTQAVRQDIGTAAQREALDNLQRLRQAYSQLDSAIDQNTANLQQNENIMRQAGSQAQTMVRSTNDWQAAVRALTASARQNPFENMIESMRELNNFAIRTAATLTGRVRGAITAIANASRAFASSGASMFAGLQRALQSTGNYFERLADRIERSMDRSRAAMMEMYAAGFGLMQVGREINQFGVQGLRMMGQSLDQFMEYERARNQAAIAGAQPTDAQGNLLPDGAPNAQGYAINSQIVDRIIFDLQRGTAAPPWMTDGSAQRLPVAFDARELAEGLYYYSSAIGQPITEDNREDVSNVVATIMQMAKVTNTGIETATKGVLNIAMEYGFNPRDIGSTDPQKRSVAAEELAKITAQVGYLANISTMEVSDIVETFKMVGPMANILAGGDKGQGLNDTFLLAYLASEVGLRGGNVGRGINRAFTSLLDPTKKMIEEMSILFPDEISDEESFRAKFFEPGTDTLKGGIVGLMEQLAELPIEQQASALAALFTENATRMLAGTMREFTEGGGIQGILDQLEGDNPFEWLEAAVAESANSINGWYTFMANGWFQFQAAIIGSIKGPLMSAFQLIGEFLFEFAERIQLDPNIGRVIASIVTAILSLAAVGGTVLMMAGGILLLGRAFAMLGGFVLPFIRMIAMAGATLAVLAPLFILIGVAVGLAVAAFKANLFGIQDGLNSVVGWFGDFEGNIAPMIEGMFDMFTHIADAIGIFFDAILLGGDLPVNDINTLFTGLRKIFGERLGNEMINSLMALRENLGPVRADLQEFFSASTFDVSALQHAGDVVRGFLEQVFLGSISNASLEGISALGEALGVNLTMHIHNAGNAFREFASTAISFALQVASVWMSMGDAIYSNIQRIFADGGWGAAFSSIGVILQGVAQGILGAFTAILGVVVFVTDKIADFSQGLREAEASGRTFMGMAVSFEGILRTIGTVIGLYFGARLALMFSPLAMILVRIMPLVAGLGAMIAGLAARFILVAGNVAISAAAFLAHAVVIGGYNAILGIATAINAAFTAVQAARTAATAAATAAASGNTIATAGQAAATGFLATAAGLAVGAMSVLTGANTMAAISAMGLGAAFSFVAGVVIIVVAALASLIVLLASIAAMATFAAGAMFIMVAASEGLGAAFQGLLSFLSGLWTGLQAGIFAVEAFVAGIQFLATVIAIVTGVGDAFTVLGLVAGVALSGILIIVVALAAAITVTAGAIVIALLALLAPIALIGLGFYELYQAVEGPLRDVGSAIKDGFGTALDWVEMRVAEFTDWVTGKLAGAANLLVSLNNAVTDIVGGQKLTKLDGTSAVDDLLNKRAQERLANSPLSDDNIYKVGVEVQVEGEEELEGVMGWLDKAGLGGPVKEFMVSIGLDPNSMDLSDLSSDQILDFFKSPEGFEFEAAGMDFGLPEVMDKFEKDMDLWKADAAVTARGMDSEEFWAGSDIIPPPTKPDIMSEDYLGGIADDLDEKVDEEIAKFEETKQKWATAVAGLADMALPDMFSALYDPLAGGAQGSSLISFLAGEAEGIIAKAQEGGGGQWLNMNELMADIAGSGVQLDESLVGRNLHTALRPAFQILSDQTGVAVEELMADIPLFQAPEQFQNIATVDMTQGISEMTTRFGTDMFRTVDTALAGVVNAQTGEAFFEAGLDWSELNNYAIGQAILGHDWNLADFVGEVMGISTEAANQVLLDAGLSQEAINAYSQNMYDGVEEAVLSNAGAYNVLTEKQYEWLRGATQDFKSNVISMSEAEFGEMSDTMKLILTNMGYSFVITDLIPQEAYAAVQESWDAFNSYVQGLGTYKGSIEANFQMEGDPREWLKVDEIVNAAGETMVVLEDLDGTQVHIPAAEYAEFMSSIDEAEAAAKDAGSRIKTAFDEGFRNATMGSGDGTGGGGGFIAGMGGGTGGAQNVMFEMFQNPNAGIPPALQIPEGAGTTAAQQVVAEYEAVFAAADFSDEIQSAIEVNGQVTIDIVAKVAGLELDALYSIQTQITIPVVARVEGLELDALYSLQTQIKIPVVARVAGLELDALYSMQTDIKIPVVAEVTKLDTTLIGSQEAPEIPMIAKVTSMDMSMISSVTGEDGWIINATAKVTNVNTDLLSTLYGEEGLQISISVDVAAAQEALASFNADYIVPIDNNLDTLAEQPTIINVSLSGEADVVAGIGRIMNTARVMATTYTATVALVGEATVVAAIGRAMNTGRAWATTYTGTITVLGEATVVASIGRAMNTARAFAKTYTATITVNDNATSVINGAINSLNRLDGMNAVSTLTTRQITEIGTRNIGATAATGGWRSGGQAVLVGEEGPEVVWFPTNGYVFTAPETDQMLSQSLSANANPFASTHGRGNEGGTQVNNVKGGDTYNFNGDIIISDKRSAREFFEEVDRRSGKKVEMAQRGMRAVDNTNLW